AHEQFICRGSLDRAVILNMNSPRNSETPVHVDPLVFLALQAALNLLEVRDIIHFTEIRKTLLRSHPQRIDVIQDVLADATIYILDLGAVPDRIGFFERDRLEHLDMISEQREVREDV